MALTLSFSKVCGKYATYFENYLCTFLIFVWEISSSIFHYVFIFSSPSPPSHERSRLWGDPHLCPPLLVLSGRLRVILRVRLRIVDGRGAVLCHPVQAPPGLLGLQGDLGGHHHVLRHQGTHAVHRVRVRRAGECRFPHKKSIFVSIIQNLVQAQYLPA